MRLKLPWILFLALACFLAGQVWTLWVQPELMTHVALEQMERSDEAAKVMRTANQVQQWPVVPMVFVFLVGTLLILSANGRRAEGTCPAEISQPNNEETEP